MLWPITIAHRRGLRRVHAVVGQQALATTTGRRLIGRRNDSVGKGERRRSRIQGKFEDRLALIASLHCHSTPACRSIYGKFVILDCCGLRKINRRCRSGESRSKPGLLRPYKTSTQTPSFATSFSLPKLTAVTDVPRCPLRGIDRPSHLSMSQSLSIACEDRGRPTHQILRPIEAMLHCRNRSRYQRVTQVRRTSSEANASKRKCWSEVRSAPRAI